MKINKKIFINLFLALLYYLNSELLNSKKKIFIEIDVSNSGKGNRGPGKFVKGIKDILPYNTSNCIFTASKNPYTDNKTNLYDFLYVPISRFSESYFKKWITLRESNKVILGPVFVPNRYIPFPNPHIWYERKFKEILGMVKGIAVHSKQLRNHLALCSETTHMIHKYKIIRACTNLKPNFIKPFKDRKIDILFFEKYGRYNRTKQASQLINIFRKYSKYNVVKLLYGKYRTEDMEILANNSKFIIYFSFYDTGAIGLKEIQNYGVYAFTHQKELVNNKDTTFFIPQLRSIYEMSSAFHKIIKKIKKITLSKPNSQLIASKNQEINKCNNALKDLCESL